MSNNHRPLLVQVKLNHLQFVAGDFEPLMCALAVYDFKTMIKVSEDFHFDFFHQTQQLGVLMQTSKVGYNWFHWLIKSGNL